MHMLLGALVPGHTADEALSNGKHVYDQLVRDQVFDYYVTADQDGRGISGTDRWGPYPAAAPAESEPGEQLIERGWEATVGEYEHAFDQVTAFFEDHDPEAFWTDDAAYTRFVYPFHQIGEFEGPSTYLYTAHGEGIRTKPHLDRVLTEQYDEDVWVVPADVHY